MAQLRSGIDTPKMAQEVEAAFKESPLARCHRQVSPVFEHAQWWITCQNCGALWAVEDAEGLDTYDGFCFEEVSAGDEYVC